ncbi:MAG: hypothetical protein ABR587_07940 [Candidatus Binatia bacterium]
MNAGAGSARGVGIALLGILVAGYPFLVAAGLDHLSARAIGAALLAAALAGALVAGGGASRVLSLLLRRFGVLMLLGGAAAATDNPAALMLLPSLTSVWLLGTFASSLRREPSIVAQFASAAHNGSFPDFLLPYCRKVTWMWCAFFAINAVVGGLLALAAPARLWAFYTGFLAYVMIALLATAEYVLHKSRFRFYEDGWDDRLWRRWCPPEQTALGRRTLAWQRARSTRNHPA